MIIGCKGKKLLDHGSSGRNWPVMNTVNLGGIWMHTITIKNACALGYILLIFQFDIWHHRESNLPPVNVGILVLNGKHVAQE